MEVGDESAAIRLEQMKIGREWFVGLSGIGEEGDEFFEQIEFFAKVPNAAG